MQVSTEGNEIVIRVDRDDMDKVAMTVIRNWATICAQSLRDAVDSFGEESEFSKGYLMEDIKDNVESINACNRILKDFGEEPVNVRDFA